MHTIFTTSDIAEFIIKDFRFVSRAYSAVVETGEHSMGLSYDAKLELVFEAQRALHDLRKWPGYSEQGVTELPPEYYWYVVRAEQLVAVMHEALRHDLPVDDDRESLPVAEHAGWRANQVFQDRF